uniref:Uncharacterized protein n=1 Tax=Rhizophora mucronata TaxID=61149 RepID=A0A2P2N0L5_RHIMU
MHFTSSGVAGQLLFSQLIVSMGSCSVALVDLMSRVLVLSLGKCLCLKKYPIGSVIQLRRLDTEMFDLIGEGLEQLRMAEFPENCFVMARSGFPCFNWNQNTDMPKEGRMRANLMMAGGG